MVIRDMFKFNHGMLIRSTVLSAQPNSVLGYKGIITAGSGSKELLCVVFAPNSVDQILTEHMHSPSIRKYFLVQLALARVIFKKYRY